MKRKYPTRGSSFIAPVKAQSENPSNLCKSTKREGSFISPLKAQNGNPSNIMTTSEISDHANKIKQIHAECEVVKNDLEILKYLSNKENVSEFDPGERNGQRRILKETVIKCSADGINKSPKMQNDLLYNEFDSNDTQSMVGQENNILKEIPQNIISSNSSKDLLGKTIELDQDTIEKIEFTSNNDNSLIEYESKSHIMCNEKGANGEILKKENEIYSHIDKQCDFKETQKNIQGQKALNKGKSIARIMKPRKPISKMTLEEYKEFYIRTSKERSYKFPSDLPEINDTEIDDIILPIANEFGVFELFIRENEDTNVLNGMRKAILPRCSSILLGLNHDIDPNDLSPIRDIDGHIIIFLAELEPSKIDWAVKALMKLSPRNE